MNKYIIYLIGVIALPAYSLEVIFINPSFKGSPFWDQVSEVANAAAVDLNISLKTFHSGGHRLLQKKQISKIVQQDTKPDYLIFMPYDGTALETFSKLEFAKIPFITLERTLFPDLQIKLGQPRQHFDFWLGEIYHDNKKAGRLLAHALIRASKNRVTETNGLNVVGISGDMSGHSSERNAGLIEELEQDTDFSLAQIVNARWDRKVSGEMFLGLLQRYPDIEIVWTTADIMALGVIDVAVNQGMTINQNLFIGGFDWTIEGLKAIENDSYTASVGGHFMQTAWALIKLFDHFNGIPAFTNTTEKSTYQLQLIDGNNISDYQVLINNPDWSKVDFRQFSRIHQKKLSDYQFDFAVVLRDLNQ